MMSHSVTVHLEQEWNIAVRMAEMREWLDSRGIEPAAFQYQADEKGATCRLDFKVISDAHAFVEAFGAQTGIAK
jgi:hypothetical protein